MVGNVRFGDNVPFQVVEKRAALTTSTGDIISIKTTKNKNRVRYWLPNRKSNYQISLTAQGEIQMAVTELLECLHLGGA